MLPLRGIKDKHFSSWVLEWSLQRKNCCSAELENLLDFAIFFYFKLSLWYTLIISQNSLNNLSKKLSKVSIISQKLSVIKISLYLLRSKSRYPWKCFNLALLSQNTLYNLSKTFSKTLYNISLNNQNNPDSRSPWNEFHIHSCSLSQKSCQRGLIQQTGWLQGYRNSLYTLVGSSSQETIT